MGKKVLITHGWTDKNKGDSAIVIGMINALKMVMDKDTKFIHISEFSPSDKRITESYPHLLDSHSDLEINGSILPILPIISGDKKYKGYKVLSTINYLVRSLVLLLLFPIFKEKLFFLFNNDEKKTLLAYKNADVVYSKGGGFIYTQRGVRSIIRLYRVMYPIILGILFKKPVVIYAQSIGPLNNNLDKWFTRKILNKCSKILVRENISKDLLDEINVLTPVKVVPDAAFLLDLKQSDLIDQHLEKVKGKPIIAITVRQWSFKNPDGYRKYLGSIAKLADYFIENKNASIMIVPQVIGPNEFEDDRIASKDLYDFIKNKNSVTLFKEDFSPQELKYLYKHADMLVGTRFHSVILSASSCVPSIALGYLGPKTQGIMDLLGIGQYVIHVDDVSYSEIERFALEVWEKRLEIKQMLGIKMQDIRNKSLESALYTLDI